MKSLKIWLTVGLITMVGSFLNTFAQTVNLTTVLQTTVPTGSTLQWHTVASNPSASTLVANTTAAGPGVYYAYFFNSAGNCYTKATPVRVATNTCPTNTVDLAALVNVPTGSTVTFHSTATATDANRLTSSVVTATSTPTIYYAAFSTGSGCYSQTNPIVVVASTVAAPTAIATGNAICSGQSATVTGSCPAGSTLTLFSDQALTTTLSSTTVTPTQTTTYYAACVNGTCKSTGVQATVTVNPTPAAPLATVASVTNACPAQTVNLNSTLGTPQAGVTYEWFTTNSSTGTLVANPAAVATSGTFYVFAKTSAGCYSTTGTPITVTISPCIVANPDLNNSTTLNTSLTIPVLSNDRLNGNNATLANVTTPQITTQSANGTAVVQLDGSILFTPTSGFTGSTTFIYRICDAVQTSVCDTALVSVNVGCPVLTAPAGANATPASICIGQSSTLSAQTCTNGILTWYTDATLTSVLSNPVVSPVSTTTYYASCVSGSCKSPSVAVTVTNTGSCNQPPVATNDIAVTPQDKPVSGNVLTNDSDPNGDPLTVATTPTTQPTKGTVILNADGTFVYTPSAGQTGSDTFCYQISDGKGGTSTACTTIDIIPNPTPGNDAPVAANDNTSTTVNTPVTLAVKANDTDPDGNVLGTPTIITQPTNGNAIVNPDGTVTYVPNAGFKGTDTFVYQVCDNGSPVKCDNATATILVTEALTGTKPPIAVDDANITTVNVPVSGTVAANDLSPSGNPLTFTALTQPANGSVVLNPNGTYTYTPPAGYVGNTSFTYQTCDNSLPALCDKATVSIAVLPARSKVQLLPKAWLQGALFGVTSPTGIMRDDLRALNLLPTTHPYTALGLNPISNAGNVAAGVFEVTGNNAIVDWVYVELRDANDKLVVRDSRAALIQRDGDIVDVNGVSPITFDVALSGNYYVVIMHRNHLGIMSANTVALSEAVSEIDFKTVTTPTYNLDPSNVTNVAQVDVLQGVALWAGNTLFDDRIIYQGTANDVNPIYQSVITASGNILVTPFFKVRAYSTSDVNLNGEAIFQGTGNDVEYIYLNVIKNHPGNVLRQNFFIIREQLPKP